MTADARAKGVVFLGARDYYTTHVPGGVDAVAKLLSPATRDFFGGAFLAAGWYPAPPIVEISAAAAKAAAVPHRTLVLNNAAWLAHRDVNGAYRMLLKLATPHMVATRLPRAALQYFNFGSPVGSATGDRTFQGVLSQIPTVMADWMGFAVEGFTPVALQLSGARKPTVAITRKDEPSGTSTITCNLAWE